MNSVLGTLLDNLNTVAFNSYNNPMRQILFVLQLRKLRPSEVK